MKRILFFLATIFMLLPQSSRADVWDGTSIAYTFNSGIGTAESPYVIANSSQFAFFMKQVRSGINYSGKYILLTADIDLNNQALTTGGTFAGTFNGGHRTICNACKMFETLSGTICNLKFTATTYCSMVQTITTSGNVFNLYRYGADDKYEDTNANIPGLICYTNNGRIQNCYVGIKQSATYLVYGKVTTAYNYEGNSYADYTYFDYYIAYANTNNGYIENCCNDIKTGHTSWDSGRYKDDSNYLEVFSADVNTNTGTITGNYTNFTTYLTELNEWVTTNGASTYSFWATNASGCPLANLNNTTCAIAFVDPYFGFEKKDTVAYYGTVSNIPVLSGNATFLGWKYGDIMVDRSTHFEQDATLIAQWEWNIIIQPTQSSPAVEVDDAAHAEYTWTELRDYGWTGDWASQNKGQNNTTDSVAIQFNTKATNYQLHFDWGVSADNYDKIIITLDGNTLISKSGKNTGTYSGFVDEKGSHTLIVKYKKDISGSLNQDKAWIQNLYIFSKSIPMSNSTNSLSEAEVTGGNAYYCTIGYTNNPTVLTTNMISKTEEMETSKTKHYDVNNDGKIDINDVNAVISKICGN